MGEGTKDLQLGTPLCVIVENESDVAAFKDFKAGEGSDCFIICVVYLAFTFTCFLLK